MKQWPCHSISSPLFTQPPQSLSPPRQVPSLHSTFRARRQWPPRAPPSPSTSQGAPPAPIVARMALPRDPAAAMALLPLGPHRLVVVVAAGLRIQAAEFEAVPG